MQQGATEDPLKLNLKASLSSHKVIKLFRLLCSRLPILIYKITYLSPSANLNRHFTFYPAEL